MNKLAGGGASEADASEQSAEQSSDTSGMAATTAEIDARVKNGDAGAGGETTSSKSPADAAVQEGSDGEGSEGSLKSDDAPAAAVQGSTSETIHIDFERLSAAGFLTPDQANTQRAEEYQHLKRRILGNIALGKGANGRPANVIMITSSVPSEGKTYTSMNLALSIAMEIYHTVLVVDTDVMKRDLSMQMGLLDRRGLFEYLNNQVADIADVIYRTNLPNLAVIPSGNFVTGSTELLASVRMTELVNEFAERYRDRVILFDTPPLLATTTAVALSPMVGQLILVVEAGETRAATVQQAIGVIERTPVTGLILNKAKKSQVAGYDYYGYGYGYGQTNEGGSGAS